MAKRLKCFNISCEYNNSEFESCENSEGVVIGVEGTCSVVLDLEEQDRQITYD